MGIIITQTMPESVIDRTYSKMEIETQNARFKLHQNHAKVEIEN